MKHLLIIGLLGGISICTQNVAFASMNNVISDTIRFNKKGPFVENDTVFLSRYGDNTNGYYKFKDVYIESNRQSKNYQKVLKHIASINNNINEWNINNVKEHLKFIKKDYSGPLAKHPISVNLPEAWTPLRSFQGKYYINELDTYYTFWLTDSCYVRNYMDGPFHTIIQSFKKISPKHYQFRIAYSDHFNYIDLYMIDDMRKIAVVIESTPGGAHEWKGLFVSAETVHLFDLIAYHSSDMPDDEVEYDEIDFDALLKPFKENKK